MVIKLIYSVKWYNVRSSSNVRIEANVVEIVKATNAIKVIILVIWGSLILFHMML